MKFFWLITVEHHTDEDFNYLISLLQANVDFSYSTEFPNEAECNTIDYYICGRPNENQLNQLKNLKGFKLFLKKVY